MLQIGICGSGILKMIVLTLYNFQALSQSLLLVGAKFCYKLLPLLTTG